MKLAHLILPLADNAGTPLDLVHAELRGQIGSVFGGYTCFEGHGAWHTAREVIREPVMVYMIAMERADCPKLRSLAQWVAGAARQESVMIVTPNGDVDFVHPNNFSSAA
jgi:hypothetical protein